jgi:hypothetical protein
VKATLWAPEHAAAAGVAGGAGADDGAVDDVLADDLAQRRIEPAHGVVVAPLQQRQHRAVEGGGLGGKASRGVGREAVAAVAGADQGHAQTVAPGAQARPRASSLARLSSTSGWSTPTTTVGPRQPASCRKNRGHGSAMIQPSHADRFKGQADVAGGADRDDLVDDARQGETHVGAEVGEVGVDAAGQERQRPGHPRRVR